MFQRAITFSAMLLLAGAAVFMTAGPVQARGGGGHGGGGHGGGFHGGGGRVGGYHGGYYHGGYGRGYGHGHGYGYRHYYGGYYPYYDQSYLYGADAALENAYADDTPLLGDSVTYDSGANNASAPTQIDTTAHVTVSVPAEAKIWIDGTKTTSTGAVREYQSPPLTPGSPYSYEIQASWNENGKEVTQTQKVAITAGAHVNVSFPVSSATTKQQASGG